MRLAQALVIFKRDYGVKLKIFEIDKSLHTYSY